MLVSIDGLDVVASGTAVVTGDAALEIRAELNLVHYQIAIKFRTEPGAQEVRFGNPKPSRVVIHLVNVDQGYERVSGCAEVGTLAGRPLLLAYSVTRWTGDPIIRTLNYTLSLRPA